MLAGALGVYLLSISGIMGPQLDALQDLMRVLGRIRSRTVVAGAMERAIWNEFCVKTSVKCEARLPLYWNASVEHRHIHFFEDDGWADLLGPTPPLQK